MGDDTWRMRALIPSKKSKAAPVIIHTRAILASNAKAYPVAMQPDIRLQQVIALGMFLIIGFDISCLL